MLSKESHERLSFERLALILSIPTAVSFAAGVWIAVQVIDTLGDSSSVGNLAGSWRSLAGQALATLGILIAVILASVQMIQRRTRKTQQERSQLISPAQSSGLTLQEIPQKGEGVVFQSEEISGPIAEAFAVEEALKRELSWNEEVLRMNREKNKILVQLEMKAAQLKDPRSVAQQFVLSASELCRTSTLFFAFHEKLRVAILQAEAGFPTGNAPAGMSFPLTDEIMSRILLHEQRGEMPSLANYPPLEKLVFSRLGVTHFEAWGVVGYQHSKILGVLVVLQPGVEGATNREPIWRMMRATSLAYENALLSK